MKKSLQSKMQLCSGCRNNRYNMGKGFVERPGIDAVVTSEHCWSLPNAKKVKRRIVSLSQVPPWTHTKVTVLDCFSMPGYFITDKER